VFFVPTRTDIHPRSSVTIVIKTAVARRYAKALFGLIEMGQVETTRDGLVALADAVTTSASLKHVLASPAFKLEDKRAVLESISQRLGCPPIMGQFLAQLIKKNRVGFLQEIAAEFAILADRQKGMQPVEVSSASPFTPEHQDQLRSRLRTLLQRDVDLTFHTKPTLLAGLRIRIGSTLFDSTVRTRLDTMRTLVTKE
jgi:F-type H+-transporting ATPase subunit delta